MARRSKLWKQQDDIQELRRIVRNYNAKLRRQREKLLDEGRRYEAAHLPERASVRDLRKSIKTRKEYDAALEKLQDYIKTGNKYKIDKKTDKALHATIRDFNDKIDRIAKKTKNKGELAALPSKLDRDVLIRNAGNKDELMRNLKEYKEFLKSGSEELVTLPDSNNNRKMTKWEKEWSEKKAKRVNAAREKEKEAWLDAEVTYGGQKTGRTHRDIGAIADERHAPIRIYTPSSEYRDIKAKMSLLAREDREGYWNARTELARINYTETMEEIMGNDPEGMHLLRKIKSMPLDAFKRVLQSEDDLWLLLYEYRNAGDARSREIVLRKIWGEWEDRDMDEWKEEYLSRQVSKYE